MFIPIRDDNPTTRRPYMTVSLIALNTLIFLFMFFQGSRVFQYLTFEYGYIPFEITHQAELTPDLATSVWLTPFTSMFMHGGWLHLIGNMLFLWIFGNNIEDYMGPVKFILFYILSGLAAISLYTLFGPSSKVPLIGASGAIAGVMGAYIVLFPKADITVLIVFFLIQFIVVPAKIVLGIWFFLQLFMSLTGTSSGGGVAWMAHVGGFLFGYIVMKVSVKIFGRGTTPGGGQRVYRVRW